MMEREIKFRAWDGSQMLTMPLLNMYGLSRFFGILSDDTPIMQFTGLKDKNGKEIYEGDIITRPYRDVIVTGTVVFSDGFSSFKTAFDSSSIDGVKSKTLVPFMPHEMDQIEIIGNIHEHPELLTQLEKK